jgi:hypothetical protein
MKTNLTLNGVGNTSSHCTSRGNMMEAKGVMSIELMVGSKTMATAFFIVEVQGNYSLILGHIGFMLVIASLLLCISF